MRAIGLAARLTCLVVLAALALPEGAAGLPSSVRRFVDNLDVRCFRTVGKPLNLPLTLRHLDPVLVKMGLAQQKVTLGQPQQLCVPVDKNGIKPKPDTLPFTQFVDWKCYGVKGNDVNLNLVLTQLNPVVAGLLGPGLKVTMHEPQQLCVPVAKNNSAPPPEVRHLVENLDVECFRVSTNQQVGGQPITLAHLDPLFAGLPPEKLKFLKPATQLCVPVAKNDQIPPTDVLPYSQFSDVLCYPMAGSSLGKTLTLTHLDPVLVALKVPAEKLPIGGSIKLCVPVAKNGQLPPGSP